MKVRLLLKNGVLTARLHGELDHHSAAAARDTIDDTARRMHPHTLRLDFSELTFMDSSGIGLILGRLRLVSTWGGKVIVTNVSPELQKMIELAGIPRLVEVRKEALDYEAV